MARLIVLLVAGALTAQTLDATANAVSPVQKVIQLIEDMEGKVQRDQTAVAKAFEEEAKNWDDVTTKKRYAIKDTTEGVESLTATITDESAKLSQYTESIQELTSQIGGAEGELSKAVSLREKEHKDFKGIEAEMVATVDQLSGAHANLKRTFGGASLAQVMPDARRALDTSIKALGILVEASFVTHAQRSKVQAFLQARASADDALSLSNSLRASGGNDAILETLEEMTDKAEGTLSNTRREEMEASHAFAMLKDNMENGIKNSRRSLSETAYAKQVSSEALAQAEKDLAAAQSALKDDTHFLNDLQRSSMIKAQEWEVIHKDSVAELKALDSAKAILSKKFGVLIQAHLGQRLTLRATSGDDAKTRALRAIQQLGKRLHSTALVSLSYRAAADPFNKVRSMVEDMIAKLMQEAAQEATKKAQCDEELSTSEATKADKENRIEKLDARIGKAKSGIAELSEGISVLSKEIAEINAAATDATALRQKEKSVFIVSEKDFSESQDACAAALQVLREYYEGGSLVQVQVKDTSKEALEVKDGSGIIGVLELAESEFAKNLADVHAAEKAAVDQYNLLLQNSKMSLAVKETEMKGKEAEVQSVKVGLLDSTSDKQGLSTELDAVLQYLDELKPQCETKVPSYAERKAAREAEIDGLKEALAVLGA